MDSDDRQIGRVLSRREVLAFFGTAAGAALLAACAPGLSATTEPTTAPTPATTKVATQPAGAVNTVALPSCIVRPALTEGPYFVDEKLNRADIRSDPSNGTAKDGAQLDLTIRVSQIGSSACMPLQGTQVDIWHCDALGVYSDATDPSFGNTKGTKFLRGYQLTDANGIVKFTTIYPGWYQGRAVHIHFKIRTPSSNASYDFTSQFFFDDALSEQVYAQQPYAAKGTRGIMKNNNDGIYQQSGGQTLLNVGKNGQGYVSTFDIGLQIS